MEQHEFNRFHNNPHQYLTTCGYTDIRQINGKWYGILIFTTCLYCDLDEYGNKGGRICFESRFAAQYFLSTWDGISEPTKQDGMITDKRVK